MNLVLLIFGSTTIHEMKETVFTVGIIVVIMTHVVWSRVIPEMVDCYLNTSRHQSKLPRQFQEGLKASNFPVMGK